MLAWGGGLDCTQEMQGFSTDQGNFIFTNAPSLSCVGHYPGVDVEGPAIWDRTVMWLPE